MNPTLAQLAHEAGITVNAESEKFAEMIVERCASMCGSQADRKNLRQAFGLPVESDVKYPGPDAHWSITSQYDRNYNLPK